MKGFTLVEVMVVVLITITMLGLGVINISRFSSRDNVAAAKNEVASAVKMARNYAVTMQVPTGWADQLDYVALVVIPPRRIVVYPVNISYGVGPSYFSKLIGSDDIVVGAVNFGDILFSVPQGKLLQRNFAAPKPFDVVPKAAGNVAQIYIKSTISSGVGLGDTKSVNIWKEGILDENDASVSLLPTVTSFPVPTTIPH